MERKIAPKTCDQTQCSASDLDPSLFNLSDFHFHHDSFYTLMTSSQSPAPFLLLCYSYETSFSRVIHEPIIEPIKFELL